MPDNQRKLDVMSDLTKGERQYLARKGITGREFDQMSVKGQHEWKEEMKNPAYDKNDRDYKSENARFTY